MMQSLDQISSVLSMFAFGKPAKFGTKLPQLCELLSGLHHSAALPLDHSAI